MEPEGNLAGPNVPVRSLYQMVQTGIDQSDIQLVNSQINYYELLYDLNDTRVYVKYVGTAPIVTVDNNFTVTITSTGQVLGTVVIGTVATTNNSTRIIRHVGGIPGNTSSLDIIPPTVTKMNSTFAAFGAVSAGNPYTIDIDNNPSVAVIETGTVGNPINGLRLEGLNWTNHIIKLQW